MGIALLSLAVTDPGDAHRSDGGGGATDPNGWAGGGGLTGFGLRIQPMPAPSVTIVASIQRSSEAFAKRSICFSGCANSSGFS